MIRFCQQRISGRLGSSRDPLRSPGPRYLSRAKERKVPKNKVVPLEEAMSHVESGMSIAVGGFIGQGDPLTLIDYLKTMT
jgi:hypothetical protein